MFPGMGPAVLNYVFYARWDPRTKSPDIIITGNGKVISKPNAGDGGAKGTKGKTVV